MTNDNFAEEDLRANPDTVPNYVEQLFTLSKKMLDAGVEGWALEVRSIANCLAEGLGLFEYATDNNAVLDSVYVNGDLIDYDKNGNPLEAD
jgi:hypothetical protein